MLGVDFFSVDVETANYDRASICQIGVVTVRDGQIIDRWESLVDPQATFNFTDIHGIDESAVADQPTLPGLWEDLCRMLESDSGRTVLVSHTAFDRTSFGQAAARHSLRPLSVEWLDSALVARETWPARYRRRWNLRLIADDLGISFQHHDALEDAEAAAHIVIRASEVQGFGIQEWIDKFR